MSDTGNSCHLPAEYSAAGDPGNQFMGSLSGSADPLVALMNLTAVRTRMDSLQRFLADSLNRNILLPKDQMDQVSSELVSAIHQVIVNGATLLASSQAPPIRPEVHDPPEPTTAAASAAAEEESDREDERMDGDDVEIVELDAVELLAEHIHFCEICGKGFKRDANLRMHMRAHGNQFKTPEALSKPENPAAEGGGGRRRRFSCPYVGCNRNQRHRNFRPLKSVICVKNHFKRSHCPKMYSCTRCHKKSFSVMADLKSHLKHCGHCRWKCSCGTTFSRKDKLFGHMALFEGHMPAVNASADDDENPTPAVAEVLPAAMGGGDGSNEMENGWLFEGLLEGFGSIANQDMTIGASSSTTDLNTDIMEFFNF